jgi:hypothetical protein
LGEIVGLCLCVTATGGYAVYAGQDANWDQRNYHIYAVHSWLTGRSAVDLAPAQIQTWLNPAPHLLQYFLIRNAPPVVAGFVMGAVAGLNGVLLWVLARRLQKGDWQWTARAAAALVVIMGLTGSLFLSFAGTSFGEYLCSLPVLAAVIALVGKRSGDEAGPRAFLIAGLCLGAACGFKLTSLVYALGMSAALLALWPFLRFRVTALLSFAIGGGIGFAALGGYWSTKLWLAFGNPMFPFFNGIFRSPFFEASNFTDARFLPASLPAAMVSYPWGWSLGLYPTSEVPFREPRFAFVAALLPLAICAMLLHRGRGRSFARERDPGDGRTAPRDFWLIGLFFVFSYAIWLGQFGIQRYALPLELLTGVVAWMCLEQLLRSPRRAVLALALLAAFALVWTRPPDWERVPYGADWFGFVGVDRSGPATLYLSMSWRPTAYAIPAFRPEDTFVRLGGNMPLEPGTAIGRLALDRIRTHQGPIRTLAMEPLDEAERGRLGRFGMTLVPDSCKEFRSRMDVFQTCGAQATSGSRPGQ